MKYKKFTLQDFFEILKDKILSILLLTMLFSGTTFYFQTKTSETNLKNYWAVEITKKINGNILVSYIKEIKKQTEYKNNNIENKNNLKSFEIDEILNSINDITNSSIMSVSSYYKIIFDVKKEGKISDDNKSYARFSFRPETFKMKFLSYLEKDEILIEIQKLISESNSTSNALIDLNFDVEEFNTKDLYSYDLISIKFIQTNTIFQYLKILIISLIVSCFLIIAYVLRNKIRLL